MKTRFHRLLAPIAAVTVAAVCVMGPAAAAVTPEPSATPSATATGAAPDAAGAGQFTSLSGALLSMYANQAGQTLDSYLTANDMMVAATGNTATGTQVGVLVNGASPNAAGATKLTATNLSELDATLATAGFGLDLRNYTSLSSMATDVVSKAHTADGQVTLAGAQWVSQLGALRSPSLTAPTVGGATMPGIPQEALPFGLLMDEAIAGTVLNSPDLFAAAMSSGVGSKALTDVFQGQMLSSWQKSNESLTSVLPNVCTGAMMAVMASGDARSADAYSGCDPSCTTGGLYLNNQASRIFAPDDKALSPNFADKLWNYETLIQAQSWQKSLLLEQNPSLVQGLISNDGTTGGAMLCSAAKTSTTEVLKGSLSGIFGSLRVTQ